VIDAPIQRYLAHAIADGAPLSSGALLAMEGRIKVGRWLSFDARQEFHGHAFTWTARAGLGRVRPLRVTVGWWFGTDRYQPFVDATIRGAERTA
jgi:hypothetical protein